jgi:imidazole glycerol-phosphate synthase subunit HisF
MQQGSNLLTKRIIPCLDVADGRVVKGVNFENLVDSGDPFELANRYYTEGADELTFLDVTASKENRSTILETVKIAAESIFIPLTVGGGIRTPEDVAILLDHGADKVSVGSAAISSPKLIESISNRFGSQVLVISLDIKRDVSKESGFGVTSHGGSVLTQLDALDWIETVQELGAGELLVNSMDFDGTKRGFDLELLELATGVSTVPVIASGGAGSAEDFLPAARLADALLAASIFHKKEVSISEVKVRLSEQGVPVRQVAAI